MCQKSLKNVYFAKCLIIWILFYPNTRAISEKDTTNNIVFLTSLKNGNQLLINRNCLVHFWQIYLSLLDCLWHDLLLPKLHAYGFSLSVLKFIHSYLKNWKQRTKIDWTYSSWKRTERIYRKDLCEDPCFLILFYVTCSYLFFSVWTIPIFSADFASYANDSTPYVAGDSIKYIINWLENDSIKLFKWLADNQMKANKDKYHLLISSRENITLLT